MLRIRKRVGTDERAQAFICLRLTEKSPSPCLDRGSNAHKPRAWAIWAGQGVEIKNPLETIIYCHGITPRERIDLRPTLFPLFAIAGYYLTSTICHSWLLPYRQHLPYLVTTPPSVVAIVSYLLPYPLSSPFIVGYTLA